MRIFIRIFSSIFPFIANAQNKNINYKFSENKIYLCYRGTESKRNLVAGDFNINGSPATHIGIGLRIKGCDVIFNVSSDKIINNSALIRDSLTSFYNIKSDLYYMSIFSRVISKNQKLKLISIINNLSKKRIVFDKKFELFNNDTLYCSEFVLNTLGALYNKHFKPSKLILKTYLYKTYFNANFLLYYPVDYLAKSKEFKKCIEHYYIK